VLEPLFDFLAAVIGFGSTAEESHCARVTGAFLLMCSLAILGAFAASGWLQAILVAAAIMLAIMTVVSAGLED
jgi:uncharacterized membrane protein